MLYNLYYNEKTSLGRKKEVGMNEIERPKQVLVWTAEQASGFQIFF